MKKKTSFLGWSILFSILILLLIFGDFLAYHDIANDYVSQEVLDAYEVTVPANWPDWASTRGEWALVQISMVLKTIFIILIIFFLSKSVRIRAARAGQGAD